MKTITYPVNPEIDKSEWPAGPWDGEPDKVQWEDKATGLPCLAVRNRMGAWCGYVGVPQGHRLHGKHYNDVEADDAPSHGGLTFSSSCQEGAPENQGICHVVEPGEDDNVWWLGFDCAHGGDLVPYMLKLSLEYRARDPERYANREDWETYKDLAYVQARCVELAAWLKAAA